ncbi:MAG: polyprenyl synthetase family protein [Candidatus Thorarchaeota archaeon]
MSDRRVSAPTSHNPAAGSERSPKRHVDAGRQLLVTSLLQNPDIRMRMSLVNRAIDEFIERENGEPEVLYEAAKHLLRAGGKRLRSLIVILSCEAVGGDPKAVLPFAVAVELVQTASLMHDDIVDDDVLRRGVETAHKKFGTRIAVLAGDLLVAQAIRLIGEMASPELLAMVGKGGVLLCEGEASDMLMDVAETDTVSTEDYLRMIQRKTASLMRVAAGVGVLIGDGTEKEKEALMEYAEKLGMAFQIRDDVLNLTVSTDVTGKSMLSDLEWKRSNYVLVHCLENAPEPLRECCVEALNRGNLEEVLRVVDESGSIRHADELARRYAQEAKEAIRPHNFPVGHLLEIIADFVVERTH